MATGVAPVIAGAEESGLAEVADGSERVGE
jgi:hypothetical protein